MTIEIQNPYSDYFIDPPLQRVNRIFDLSFENNDERKTHKFFFSKVEIKFYKVMIDKQSFFDQTIKNDLITYDKIRKITTCQGDSYKIDC